jgi:hypothetical protein
VLAAAFGSVLPLDVAALDVEVEVRPELVRAQAELLGGVAVEAITAASLVIVEEK